VEQTLGSNNICRYYTV